MLRAVLPGASTCCRDARKADREMQVHCSHCSVPPGLRESHLQQISYVCKQTSGGWRGTAADAP